MRLVRPGKLLLKACWESVARSRVRYSRQPREPSPDGRANFPPDRLPLPFSLLVATGDSPGVPRHAAHSDKLASFVLRAGTPGRTLAPPGAVRQRNPKSPQP